MATKRVTEGGRRLGQWITKHYKGNLSAFAREHALDRATVHRAIHGDRWGRITVDFATRVQSATSGAVKIAHWSSETAVEAA